MRDDVVIRDARDPGDIPAIRRLFEAYAASLDVDLCFQNFAQELAALPGDYAPPRGALLVAERGDAHVGCVALRPLGDDAGAKVGEVKRLYVVPEARGTRTGRGLMHALIEHDERAGALCVARISRMHAVLSEPATGSRLPGAHAAAALVSRAQVCSHGRPSLRQPPRVPRRWFSSSAPSKPSSTL